MFSNNKIVNFDTKKIKIKESFLSLFKEKDFQTIFTNFNDKKIYEILYAFSRTNEFNIIYKKLLYEFTNVIGSNRYYYQAVPSFRIHRHKSKSVNFHTDVMYGHGTEVINVWVPLTQLNKKNTLWLSNQIKSTKLNSDFNKKALSMDKLNLLGKKISSPFLGKYGSMLIFNSSSMHGTVINNTKINRLSFDFRILLKGKSSGTKSMSEFYKSNFSIKKKPIIKKSVSFIYKRNVFLENMSHSLQREVINAYSDKNNFNSVVEESEIHGVNHYPHLVFYITNYEVKDIIMASLLCLPANLEIRNKLIKDSLKHKKILHFALENITTKNTNIEIINKFYINTTNSYKLLK